MGNYERNRAVLYIMGLIKEPLNVDFFCVLNAGYEKRLLVVLNAAYVEHQTQGDLWSNC